MYIHKFLFSYLSSIFFPCYFFHLWHVKEFPLSLSSLSPTPLFFFFILFNLFFYLFFMPLLLDLGLYGHGCRRWEMAAVLSASVFFFHSFFSIGRFRVTARVFSPPPSPSPVLFFVHFLFIYSSRGDGNFPPLRFFFLFFFFLSLIFISSPSRRHVYICSLCVSGKMSGVCWDGRLGALGRSSSRRSGFGGRPLWEMSGSSGRE